MRFFWSLINVVEYIYFKTKKARPQLTHGPLTTHLIRFSSSTPHVVSGSIIFPPVSLSLR